MDYRVSLDMYKGPIDLLLYLIRENEVDIYDIPVARITEQYMQYLEMLKLVDPNLVGDFLVMAATLAEIKSRMLLPSIEQGQEGVEAEDPRMELVRQLLEYRRYKEMASELADMAAVQSRRFIHPVPKMEAEAAQGDVDLSEVSVWDLFRSFSRLMKATLGSMPRTIVDSDVPVYQHVELVARLLRAQGIITFLSVFERCKDRLQVVGAFVAVLEMVRRGVISVEQTHDRDEVRIRMRDENRLAGLLAELRRPGGERVLTEPKPDQTTAETPGETPEETVETTPGETSQGQSVTVLATRWENCLLFRHPAAGLEMFIDFGFHADSLDSLEEMLRQLGTELPSVNVILMTHMHGDHYDEEGLKELLRRRAACGAGPLRFYVHRAEPEDKRPTDPEVRVTLFDVEPFEIDGLSGSVTVQPVRLTHSPGTCAFRIGSDYIGADSSLKEVFSDRVLAVLGAYGTDAVRSLFLDMEALSPESIEKSDVPPERKQSMLDEHGMVTDLVAAMERPELKAFFAQLETLICLHVTPDVNDTSGQTNARLITEARDRLGFSFEVPVVRAGIQEIAGTDEDLTVSSEATPDA